MVSVFGLANLGTKMRIYKLINLDSTGYLLTNDTVPNAHEENQPLRSINGYWDAQKPEYQTDIVRLYGGLPNIAFSNRVKIQLEGSSEATGQWSKLSAPDSEFWLFHSTLVIDALDQSQSGIRKLKSGRVLDIKKYAFSPEIVPVQRIFMVKTKPYDLLCTDYIANMISEYGWKGFLFQPVWDSDLEPFPVRPTNRELIARPEVYGPDGIVKGYEHLYNANGEFRQKT